MLAGRKKEIKRTGKDLEVDVGAGVEELIEFGIFLDELPFARTVFGNACSEGFFFFRRPLLLRVSHHTLI